jgi:hypothetical protein
VAGFTERGSVISHRFVGVIEFSGTVAFTIFFAAIPLVVWRGVGVYDKCQAVSKEFFLFSINFLY